MFQIGLKRPLGYKYLQIASNYMLLNVENWVRLQAIKKLAYPEANKWRTAALL